VLLPAACVTRRGDSVEVIGAALLAKAQGQGHRVIAAELDLVPCQNSSARASVRRWSSRRSVIFVDEPAEYRSPLDGRSHVDHSARAVVRRSLLAALMRSMVVVMRLPVSQNAT